MRSKRDSGVPPIIIGCWLLLHDSFLTLDPSRRNIALAFSRIPIGLIFDESEAPLLQAAFNFAADSYQQRLHWQHSEHSSSASTQLFDMVNYTITLNEHDDALTTGKKVCQLLSNGVFILAGKHSYVMLDFVIRSYADAFNVPYISLNQYVPPFVTAREADRSRLLAEVPPSVTNQTPSPQTPAVNEVIIRKFDQPSKNVPNFLIALQPTTTDAIIELITLYDWRTIIYLYDGGRAESGGHPPASTFSSSTYIVDEIQHMKWHFRQQLRLNIWDFRVTSAVDAVTIFRIVDDRMRNCAKHIILNMEPNLAREIITAAVHDPQITRRTFHFLLSRIGLDDLNMNSLTHFGGINITGLSVVDYEDEELLRLIDRWRISVAANGQHNHNPQHDPLKYSSAVTVPIMPMLHMYDMVKLIQTAFNHLWSTQRSLFDNNYRRGRVYNQNFTLGIDCTQYPLGQWEDGKNTLNALLGSQFRSISGMDVIAFSHDVSRSSHSDSANQSASEPPLPAVHQRKNYTFFVDQWRLKTGKLRMGSWSDATKSLTLNPILLESGLDGAAALPNSKSRFSNLSLNELQQMTLRVTTKLDEPYMQYVDDWQKKGLKGNDRLVGYGKDLIDRLAKELNLTYVINPVNDSSYGSYHKETDSWDGIIGEIVRGEADLGVAGLTINSQREGAVDFTVPFMTVGISIMIARPEKARPGVLSFMGPLSSNVWLCILFAYSGVCVILFIVSRFNPYEWHVEETSAGPVVINEFSFYNTMWFSLGTFMQQGASVYPRSLSGRLIGSVWFFFCLITVSSYTANLAAFLTVERMSTPISSAEDLAKQTEIEYGTLRSGTTIRFFETSDNPVYREMWQTMSARPHVFAVTNFEGVARVRKSKGKYAFLLESSANEYFSNNKPCDTIKVGENLDSKGYGIAAPNGSSLVEPLNQKILKMQEDGELTKMYEKWWKVGAGSEEGCAPPDDSGDHMRNELKLPKLAGVFYILAGGLVLAMFVAIFEFLYKAKKEAYKSHIKLGEAIRASAKISILGDRRKEVKLEAIPIPTEKKNSFSPDAEWPDFARRDNYSSKESSAANYQTQYGFMPRPIDQIESSLNHTLDKNRPKRKMVYSDSQQSVASTQV